MKGRKGKARGRGGGGKREERQKKGKKGGEKIGRFTQESFNNQVFCGDSNTKDYALLAIM